MSSSSIIGDFDLNLIKIRKPIEFPDLTIQGTAYTGTAGVPTLEEVLAEGNDANGQDINDVGTITLTDIVFPNTSVQTTAYTGNSGVPTLNEVLASGNLANNQGITQIASVTFSNNSVQSTAAPICSLLTTGENTTDVNSIVNSGLGILTQYPIFSSVTLGAAGQYLINSAVAFTIGGSVSNVVTREFVTGTFLSANSVGTYQYPNASAVYAGIGANSIQTTPVNIITTTAANAVVTLNLEAFWTGAGTMSITNRAWIITYIGFP